MKIHIPFNIFIFLWCLAGIILLGYSLATTIIEGKFEMSLESATHFFWLSFFLWYSINYVLSKKQKK